jgi:hypothetical protein
MMLFVCFFCLDVQTNFVLVSAKRALFYDWFFFDPKTDNIMNIGKELYLSIQALEFGAFKTSYFVYCDCSV